VIPESSVLIFCPTKKGTETVALQLASAFPREITDVKVHLIGVHAKKKKKKKKYKKQQWNKLRDLTDGRVEGAKDRAAREAQGNCGGHRLHSAQDDSVRHRLPSRRCPFRPTQQRAPAEQICLTRSGLTSEERELIEDAFCQRVLCVLTCTSTLAAGPRCCRFYLFL
jgi:Lhr-like helicase